MNKQLLIVDDEETILFALQRYFRQSGFGVDCARELEEAEALAVCRAYDLVIVDLSLSAPSATEGLEIVRFVRRHCPKTRLIVLTAYATADIEHEAMRRGAHAVLRKPSALADVADLASDLLEGAA